jgi:hypothetical protein
MLSTLHGETGGIVCIVKLLARPEADWTEMDRNAWPETNLDQSSGKRSVCVRLVLSGLSLEIQSTVFKVKSSNGNAIFKLKACNRQEDA